MIAMTRETFTLTVDDHLAAVLEVMEAAEADAQRMIETGPMAALDRGIDSVLRWAMPGAVAGLLLLAAGGLWATAPGSRVWSVLLVLAAPLAFWLTGRVIGLLARANAAVEDRLDAAVDPLIRRVGQRELRTAIDRGRVRVLRDTVTVTLDGNRLEARDAGGHVVTISNVGNAWRARSAQHHLVAARRPPSRDALGDVVLLPVDGPIAAALDAGDGAADGTGNGAG
jgi:hypothetical protein